MFAVVDDVAVAVVASAVVAVVDDIAAVVAAAVFAAVSCC